MRILTVSLLTLALVVSAAAADKKVIQPKGFPTGKPFSPGILMPDGTLYVSGTTGADPKTGAVPSDFEAEAKLCFDLIGQVLKEAGMSFDNAVSVQVYLTDVTLFQRMNTIYMTYFKEPRPTRTTVGVAKLVNPAHMEVTVTAHK
jgi:2-iminobutanoate/2-iminopropanoate deaminase